MDKKIERKLDEAYKHIKPYIPTEELSEMCKSCEAWCGKKHDYSECKDRMCFKCWLALVYLKWETSYE